MSNNDDAIINAINFCPYRSDRIWTLEDACTAYGITVDRYKELTKGKVTVWNRMDDGENE